jgi:K+-transporting ATPase ATPase A chain
MVHAILILAVFFAVLTLLVKPVGLYIATVFQGGRTWLDPLMTPLERVIYRLSGVDPTVEQSWSQYARSLIIFTAAGTALLYCILRLQSILPLNPADLPSPRPALSANTALSFSTTTTWQAYAGEATMSYFSQMAGLTAQNILAGAVGLAAGIAFIRGFVRQEFSTLGNFWVDLVRGVLWVLLPIAFVVALVLASQGAIATLGGAVTVTTLEGVEQVIPRGPAAALVAVNNLGTNGGGFFNANGAHPFENPSPLANLLEKLAIAVIPAALTYAFGFMAGRTRQGWVLYVVMATMLAASALSAAWFESRGNPLVHDLGTAHLENLEGKETRLGVGDTALAIGVTAGGSTGSLVASNDSLQPLSGAIVLFNLVLGGLAFGGLGGGLYTIVILGLLTTFIGGQMVGRSPQFLGKKLEPRMMTLAVLFFLLTPLGVLVLTAVASITDDGVSRLVQTGPHGLTTLLVAYATNVQNNGQGFGSFAADTNFIHATTMTAMTIGRFLTTITALAIAGSVVVETRARSHPGMLPTDTPLFGGLLLGIILIVNGLTFLPALVLGPILERMQS